MMKFTCNYQKNFALTRRDNNEWYVTVLELVNYSYL